MNQETANRVIGRRIQTRDIESVTIKEHAGRVTVAIIGSKRDETTEDLKSLSESLSGDMFRVVRKVGKLLIVPEGDPDDLAVFYIRGDEGYSTIGPARSGNIGPFTPREVVFAYYNHYKQRTRASQRAC